MPRSTDTRIARRVISTLKEGSSLAQSMSYWQILQEVRHWCDANPAPEGPTRKREEIACVVVEALRASHSAA